MIVVIVADKVRLSVLDLGKDGCGEREGTEELLYRTDAIHLLFR